MNKKRDSLKLGFMTYFITFIVFNLFNSIVFLIKPEFKDWELFSYNLYGSLLFLILGGVLFSLFLIANKYFKIKNKLVVLIIMYCLIEIPVFLMTGTLISKVIVKTILGQGKNYIMIFYPLSLILGYIASNKLIDFTDTSD